jgi:hypothetical protein
MTDQKVGDVMNVEKFIDILCDIKSPTSAAHEPFYAVGAAFGMTTEQVAQRVEKLVSDGLVVRRSTVAQGLPYRSMFGWERVVPMELGDLAPA